ncbi:MAG: CPBP family intramembrane metalloprotease [Eubacterium sp.]|nr:CPBP family intramembrane metalloprotease [Eubacterium sp.]
MEKKHKILDHTTLGYFILFFVAELFIGMFGYIDKFLAKFIPGYGMETHALGRNVVQASGIGYAIGSVVFVLLFTLWFRPHFKGCFSKKGIIFGLCSTIPVLTLSFVGSVLNITEKGLTASIIIAVLKGMAPGFSEEVGFRGVGIANYMRKAESGKDVMKIFWISSIFFGLFHSFNIIAGADIVSSIVQSVSAIGMGMLFGAIYLRTGNMWPTIIAHWAIDSAEMCRADLNESGAKVMEILTGDYFIIASSIVGGIIGFILVRKQYHGDILELWKDEWNKTDLHE